MRQIRDAGQRFPEFFVQLRHLLIERRDAVTQFAHLLLEFGSIDALPFEFADLGALGISQRLQLLGLGHGRPAAPVQVAKLLHIQREGARREARGDGVQIGSKEVEIVHGLKLR